MCNFLGRPDSPTRCYKLPQEAFLGVVALNFGQRRHQRKETAPLLLPTVVSKNQWNDNLWACGASSSQMKVDREVIENSVQKNNSLCRRGHVFKVSQRTFDLTDFKAILDSIKNMAKIKHKHETFSILLGSYKMRVK